jgi:hypothetical protein
MAALPSPRPALTLLAVGALACAGDRSGGATCGLALVVGPRLIQQQTENPRAVLPDAPIGLPATLPARVAGRSDSGGVEVQYEASRLLMRYQGAAFPAQPGYGLLVVDDTSRRAMGVLIYDADVPRDADNARIGTVRGGDVVVPLFGVLVDWANVSNPRCPLLGQPTASPSSRDS